MISGVTTNSTLQAQGELWTREDLSVSSISTRHAAFRSVTDKGTSEKQDQQGQRGADAPGVPNVRA
jgi:hypothetical protein